MADSVVVILWDAANDRVLVEQHGHRLPILRVGEAGFGAEVPAAVSRQLGLEGPLLDHVATFPDIFVVATAGESCPDGFRWALADEAVSAMGCPPAGDWLSQRHRPLRPWFVPGWYEDAVDYAVGVVESVGGRMTTPPYQVRHWPLSSVIRLSSSVGRFYMKSVPGADVYEPDLVAVLRELKVPHLPPRPVASDDGKRRWVSAESSGTDGWSVSEQRRAAAISALAELQQATMPHVDRLGAAFGLERWTPCSLVGVLSEVIERNDLWAAQPASYERWRGLTDEQQHAWSTAGPWLTECCHRLAELADRTGIRLSLTHSDLHAGNTQLQPDGQVAIHDWAEAGLRHPFMDLGCWIDQMSDRGARIHVDRYLAAWSDLADPADLRNMWRAAKPLSGVMALHQAIRQSEELGPIHRHAMIAVVYGWVRRTLGAIADPEVHFNNWPAP